MPLGGREKQTLGQHQGLDYRLAQEVPQICSHEETGRRRGLTELQVCVSAVPPPSIQHPALISLPAFHCCWGSSDKCALQMCIFMHNCGNFISLWCNAVKTPATSHWQWQHPEDRDFFLKSILSSCNKSMFMEKLAHSWEVSSMSAAGTKPTEGRRSGRNCVLLSFIANHE